MGFFTIDEDFKERLTEKLSFLIASCGFSISRKLMEMTEVGPLYIVNTPEGGPIPDLSADPIIKYFKDNITHDKELEARKEEKTSNGSRIGDRVFNGRKTETRLCELLTDNQVFQLMQECHKKFMHFAMRTSKVLKMFMCTFIKAFYRQSYIKEEDEFGKVAHTHRVAESKLGALVGCGIRTLQKGIVWLNKRIEDVINREKDRLVQWKLLEDKIAAYLSNRIPELVAVTD